MTAMTQLTQGSDMDDLRDEVITGLVDYGSGDIDVAIKRIMDAAETYKQRSIDRAEAIPDLRGRRDELEQFLIDEGWSADSDVGLVAMSGNPTHRRVAERLLKINDLLEQQLSPTTTEEWRDV